MPVCYQAVNMPPGGLMLPNPASGMKNFARLPRVVLIRARWSPPRQCVCWVPCSSLYGTSSHWPDGSNAAPYGGTPVYVASVLYGLEDPVRYARSRDRSLDFRVGMEDVS